MHKKQIKTVGDLIRALGGQRPVARWLNIAPSSVQKWINNNRVSRWRTAAILARIRAEGLDVAPELLGMSDEEYEAITSPNKRTRKRYLDSLVA